MHAAGQFSLYTVTASAESVDGSTPAARVTWSTTAPPECVRRSVRVNFRTSRTGPGVTTYASETEFILTDLQCATYYYIRVDVPGNIINIPHISSSPVQVFVGGKEIVCMEELHLCYKITST